MPASSPLLIVYQKTTDAVMNGRDPSTDPGVQSAIAAAQSDGFSASDINGYYQSGVTAPSRTTGGDGFLSSITNNLPLVENIASIVIPGAAPIIAGLNAAQAIASGKPLNVSTALNIATAASGLGGLDPSTVSAINTAKQVVGGINAVQTGNVAGMVNALVQASGGVSQDTATAIKLINAATAISKNDTAGALSALNSLTNSVDPQVANVATSVLKSLNPTASSSGAGLSQNASATQSTSNTSSTQASTPASTTSTAAPAASQSTTLTAAPVVGKITAFDPFGVKNPFLSSSEAQVSDSYATGGSIDDLLRILK